MGVFKELRSLAKAYEKQERIWNDSADTGIPYYGKGNPKNGEVLNDAIATVNMFAESNERVTHKDAPYYMPTQTVNLRLGVGGFLEAGFSHADIDYFKVGGDFTKSLKRKWGDDVKGYFSISIYTPQQVQAEARQLDY